MPTKIIRFEKASFPKKYRVILEERTGQDVKKKTVSFGDRRYEQYKDRTPLKLYSHLDHGDAERRKRYYQRHGRKAVKYTPKWFSHRYLW